MNIGTVRFIVVTEGLQCNHLPVQIDASATEHQANREDGAQYQLNLFDRTGEGDQFHQVFVMETKSVHLKEFADTAYKRSVFDICSQHAKKAD